MLARENPSLVPSTHFTRLASGPEASSPFTDACRTRRAVGSRAWVSAMKKQKIAKGDVGQSERQPYHVRLPGFISDEDIGLGDVIKRVTFTAGIKPCSGCERRAAAVNRFLVFSGWRSK